jgi:DNA topoisomerase-3
MVVCIAEKPSVAGEIAKVLGARSRKDGYFEGNGYQVTWTFGHLCQLKEPDGYYADWKRWAMELLPMIPPRYEVELISDGGVKKQFKVIKELYKKADYIVNCGDAGQEGELIQRWVMELAGVKCPVKRLWISSLTEEAIRDGFKNLQPQSKYDSLYSAGQARAEGDWLLGMNATRLYTLKYGGYKQVLSIGRVQTPTLAMIVDRDNEIENFKSVPYWLLTTKYRDTLFTCVKGRFSTESEGRNYLEAAKRNRLTIKDVQQKRGSEQPPQLYDLTALQVDCNRKYGFSAETTLKNIQSLYEKKLTTYPRVDTKFLTDDIYSKCPDILHKLSAVSAVARGLVGKPLPKSKRVFDNSKVTDHHAIIPTGETGGLNNLNDYERKVYDLILCRFCAVFYPNCEYAQTTVLANAGGVDFKATGRTILSEGWRVVYTKVQKDDEDKEKEDGENDVLPAFKAGESGQHVPSLVQKMTTPPKRYTEATLLQAMETAGKFVDDETLREAMKENGIGRPSSRASIIETLLKRTYIKREKKKLISTETGRALLETIHVRMLKSPELTGKWEKKLRDIERGTFTLEAFMDELSAQLVSIIKEVQSDSSSIRISSQPPLTSAGGSRTSGSKVHKRSTKEPVLVYSKSPVKEGDKCPICKKGIVRKSQYGFFCSEYKTSGCRLTYKG